MGPNLPAVEMNARYIAHRFAKKNSLPMWKVEEEIEQVRLHKLAFRLSALDPSIAIQEELGAEIGVTPAPWSCVRDAQVLLHSPIYPSFYRTNPDVDGLTISSKAKERFTWLVENPESSQPARKRAKLSRSHLILKRAIGMDASVNIG